MGREIRRVPANWEHPKDKNGQYIPLYDKDFETTAREWVNELIEWDNGTHEDIVKSPDPKEKFPYFWEWEGNPPDRESYRPKFTAEPTWYQVYETVSEGTPLTPPFATKEELVEYLVTIGDSWDGKWNRESAERFIKQEWSPSLMIMNGIMYKSNEIPPIEKGEYNG